MPITITRNPNLAKTKKRVELVNEVQKNFENIYKTSWWTGLAPTECVGFDQTRQCLTALPLLNLDLATRQDMLDYFQNTWSLTELLFQGLKTEETFVRPPYHGLRHPMIFYYGHTAVIYVNKMRIAGLINEPINLYLEKVLETGVDEMSWDDMSKNEMAWPKLIDVHQYRKTIYDLIVNIIKTHPDLDKPNRKLLMDSPFWSIWMGLEHEKIHFETSSVLIRELPIELVERPKYFAPIHQSANDQELITFEWVKANAQKVKIGKSKDAPCFGWDNEYGFREVAIKDFSYSKYQITNREYFEFVSTGAYVMDQYWAPEGLYWRKFRNTKRPCFWAGSGPEGTHEYELRTIFEMIPMPWNWPVEVNFHEAIAYANWKKEKDQSNKHYRLLTEAEFISIRKNGPDPILQKKSFRDYKNLIEELPFNYNFLWSTPEKVNEKLYGNTWHWLMDQFNPLEDFKVNALYDDFSTPCFDGKHQMILGGSFISCGDEASFFSRFHFRPHFYQHSGFRIAYTNDGSVDNGATKLSTSTEYVHPRRKNVLEQLQKENWWKEVNQPLEMTEEELKTIYDSTMNSIMNFHREFPKLSPMGTAHDPATNKLKKDFSVPHIKTLDFPKNPTNYDSILKNVFEELTPLSQLPGHPGFAAYVAGATNPISNTAQMISQTINPYSAHYMMAPGLVSLELEAINWFINLFKLNPIKAYGFFTSGSSLAALSAMMMARNSKIKGYDLSKATAYISKEGHHSLFKNWVMLGFDKRNLRSIPSTNFKMNTKELEEKILEDQKNGLEPFMIVTTVGTTKTGSIDPISEVSKIAKKYQLWNHVDGAYGAPFMLLEKMQATFSGIENCDSLTLDLHKSMNLPYGIGLLLVANKENMLFDYGGDASYMPPKPDDVWDFADISPELSRDYRGLRVWLPIKTMGIDPFILNLEEKIALIKHAHEKLKEVSELEIVSQPELTILTFKHRKSNEVTKKLLSLINADQTLFLSGANLDGVEVIRLCLLGMKLHFDRLEKGLEVIKLKAREV